MKTKLFVATLAVVALVVVGSLHAANKADLKCPVSGKPASADHVVAFNGGSVEFCCPNCPKAFSANEKKFAAKANLQLIQSKQLTQVKCPLTGRPMADDKVVDVGGVEVKVCCAGCLGKMKKLKGDELIAALLSDTSKGYEAAKK
jgi:hypothetical protein